MGSRLPPASHPLLSPLREEEPAAMELHAGWVPSLYTDTFVPSDSRKTDKGLQNSCRAPKICCFLPPTCEQRRPHPSSQSQGPYPRGMESYSSPPGLTRPTPQPMKSLLSKSSLSQVKDTSGQRAFIFYN